MNILGVIPARGGSKGVPRKNLMKVGDLSLLQHALFEAKKSKLLSRVIVSTEDPEIHQHALESGADAPFIRPMDLALDHSSSYGVVKHAVEWLEKNQSYSVDAICLLQPTTPFRQTSYIDGTIELWKKSGCDAAISVTHFDYPPHWSMSLDHDLRITNIIAGGNQYTRRQETPPAYKPNGMVYVMSKKFLYELKGVLPQGDTRGFFVPEEDSINIDTPIQLKLAQLLWMERHQK